MYEADEGLKKSVKMSFLKGEYQEVCLGHFVGAEELDLEDNMEDAYLVLVLSWDGRSQG